MQKMEQNIFGRIEQLYRLMDNQWDKTALLYGFECNGCDDNCCETEFYHHTLIEKAYLIHGFNQLPLPSVILAKKRAQKVCTKSNIAAKKGVVIRIMCPLNQEGKCILYKFRPMICRLHGVPHELLKPDGTYSRNPGCKAGSDLFSAGYFQFDRTPFYSEMAAIEKEYLSFIGKNVKIKQTIAQMLVK